LRTVADSYIRKLLAPLWLTFIFLALPPPAAASNNNVNGTWSAVNSWPLIPLHAVMMPDGRVLTYGTKADGTQTGYFIYDVWDPSAPAGTQHVTSQNTTGTDIFCSSQVVLPGGGGVFIAGGDNWTGSGTTNTGNNNSNVFNYGNNTLTRYNSMNRQRWYSSTTVLLNGETYTQGGSGGTDRPEIRDVNGVFRLLQNADTSSLVFMYPHNFIAPDGRIFGIDGNGAMYYVNTSGTGSVTNVGQLSGPTGTDSSAAMFRPGRIIQFGGNSNGARVIDITGGGVPVVTNTANLSTQRRLVTATILADGKVLATGGSAVNNELTGVNYSAEIWDPSTGLWVRGANEVLARLYHSTALLLPDATVLVAGGGAPGPQNNTNMEIYYPPYLYDASGALASRPSMTSAPTFIDIGTTFAVGLASAQNIGRVVMIRTGSVTHSWNMEQRFVELTFQQNGNQLVAQAPTHAADAPPGFYLLFVINAAGTPSIARIARVGVATTPNPLVIPSLVSPGNQSGQAGTPTSLQLSATDPNGDTLAYGASGLPAGLTINVVSGLISGTPSTAGTFNVVVTASDGINSASRSFVWTIALGPPFTLNPLPVPVPALAGNQVTFQASVTGGFGVQYKWDFDDGTPETSYSSSSSITHSFANPGIYYVTVTAMVSGGSLQTTTVVQTVHLALTANRPAVSGNLAVEDRITGSDRLWVVNQDNDSVSVFLTTTNAKIAEIAVGSAPRSLAIAPSGEVWVTNKQSANISVIDPASLTVVRTIALPVASQPFGIVAAPTGGGMYVALEATGRLLKIDPSNDTTTASLNVGPNPRHLSVTGDGSLVYVSRFITPPLPGESTSAVQTPAAVGAEIAVISGPTMTLQQTIILRHGDKPDFENQGRGIPNYLGAVAISPDGQSAWVPSKQDNIKRGVLRDTFGLNFQNTVRAISSRIDLVAGAEDHAARIDHDNSGVASAIVHDRLGIYMFVALETSREVAVVDAHGGWELSRFNTGRAPQGLALSVDGSTLYVSNFMDRTVSVFDISTLLAEGITTVPLIATLSTIGTEKLSAQILLGKQLFYDAKDTRLARDSYITCASCHNDGGHDGRVWDLTGFGEGLRNTISLRGRAGGQGFLHWSDNFDEVQDFEGQIRNLSSGTGLMADTDFNTGTRSQPLGDVKTGVSSDLDALAAYVASLKDCASSPLRNPDGSLTAAAVAGRSVFMSRNCASCHGGTAFTKSGINNPQNVGTITAASGNRLGGPLTGIDIPTLRDAWATAPYLHLGSAATLGDAIRAHNGVTVTDTELGNLVAYVSQVGNQETAAPTSTPNSGSGLLGQYFNNTTLSGAPVLQRVEAVNFGWGTASPGAGVNADQFSVRWSGMVEATVTGDFQFQTASDNGVRLWIDGVLVIDNWTSHATTTDSSGVIALSKNQRYAITMEFYENTGAAVARLRWKKPGQPSYGAIPASRLYSN
jgi:YVTN family beta-propeller protein